MFKRLLAILLMTASLGAHAYSVSQNEILDANGEEVQLRGINWFGFETTNYTVHGLWARNLDDMIAQMQQLGFNAVRLPFCPTTLQGATPTSIDYSLNPDLTGLNSLQLLDLVIDKFDAAGMYILLDHHRPDCQAISELWYTSSYSQAQWISDLEFVANRYKDVPHVIGIDLKNEPHGAATWGTGDSATDWQMASATAAAAVLADAPDWLIFVEGVADQSYCSNSVPHFWGENLSAVTCVAPNIPLNRLVFAPHTYGPDVYVQSYMTDASFPSNLASVWEGSFGFLVGQGYALRLGEFGGKYGEGDSRDVAWQDALVDYLISKGINAGFYWDWNPNSGDTGGVLMDDWVSVREDKMALLERLWGTEGTDPGDGGDDGDDGDDGDGGDGSGGGTSGDVSYTQTVNAEWGTGYCKDVVVTNNGSSSVTWTVSIAIEGTLYTSWNVVAVGTSGTVDFSGVSWNQTIAPGQQASFGYCANR